MWTRSRARDERGATLALISILMVSIIGIAAFAVDLGMQRVARSDMQALADTVAVDLARQLDGRTVTQITNAGGWTTAISRTVDRNATTTLGADPTVTATLGTYNRVTRVFTAVTGSTVPTAVQVVARTDVDFAFMPGSGAATRQSIAMAQPSGCFKIGSYALGLSTGSSSLLNGFLGNALSTTVLGYNGLVDATVTLGQLTTQLGVATVDQLMTTSVTLDQFMAAQAAILRNNGNIADAQVLEAAVISTGTLGNTALTVGNILQASQVGAGLGTSLSVLDLVSGAAFLADGSHAIAVPALGVATPGLLSTAASVTVTERPQIACGTKTATTSQVRFNLTGNLSSVLGLVGGGTFTTSVDLATASGTISNVTCTNGHADSTTVSVNKQLAGISTTINVNSLLGLPLLRVTINPVVSGSTNDSYTIPNSGYTNGQTAKVSTGSGGLTLRQATAADVTVLGILPLGQTVNSLLGSVVNPAINSINSGLITPLSGLLGVDITGADLWGLQAPTCATPNLAG